MRVTEQEVLRVKRLSATAAPLRRAHPRDAGLDLCADLGGGADPLVVEPSRRLKVGIGWAIATPPGTYGRIADKSGHAERSGVTILGGVCDERYRGEYQIVILNTGTEPFVITHGMKVAQLVLERVSYADPVEVEDLEATERGAGGFGSTGAHDQAPEVC